MTASAPRYLAHASVLAGAAIASQAANFVGALFIARFYGPHEVGLFGIFNAVLSFCLFTSTWRYELAIVTVDEDEQADDVALLVAIAGMSSAVIAVISLLVVEVLPSNFGLSSALRHTFVAIPPALFLTSLTLAGANLCVRHRQFGRVALQQFALSLLTIGAQAALVGLDLPPGGLVGGFLIGQVGAVVAVGRPLIPTLARRAGLPRLIDRMRAAAYRHREHVLFTIPYSLMTQAYYQAPVFLLGGLFDARQVGLFNLAFRTTTTPIALMPTAIAQVFFSDMARDRQMLVHWQPRLTSLLVALGVLMAPVGAIVLIFGPALYGTILGEQWRDAGLFAEILIVPNLLNGIVAGYDRIYVVLHRQRAALLVTCVLCAVSGLFMLAASMAEHVPVWLVGGWAAGHMFMVAAWSGTIYRIAGFSLRVLAGCLAGIAIVLAALTYLLWIGRNAWEGGNSPVILAVCTGVAYVILAVLALLRLRKAFGPDTWATGGGSSSRRSSRVPEPK